VIPQDYFDYPHPKNWYPLSWFANRRPDVEFITFADWPSYTNYEWLDQRIEQALAKKRTVAIVPWDEDTIHPVVPSLADTLNKYSREPVYWLSFLDPECQLIYRMPHNITCKIEEFPWYQANECYLYLHTHPEVTPLQPGPHNFACLSGRHTAAKYNFIQELTHSGVRSQGIVTVADVDDYPDDVLSYADPNPYPPYMSHSGNVEPVNLHGNVYVTGNTLNFALLDQHYADIPLFVHPETSSGIFPLTEKGYWPIMLGRLALIHARPRYMQNLQRFYSVDLSEFMNLEFDHIEGWNTQDHQRRAAVMIRSNLQLIQQARHIVTSKARELAHARWEFPKRAWQQCVNILDQLP
jgi:hypothetical protein